MQPYIDVAPSRLMIVDSLEGMIRYRGRSTPLTFAVEGQLASPHNGIRRQGSPSIMMDPRSGDVTRCNSAARSLMRAPTRVHVVHGYGLPNRKEYGTIISLIPTPPFVMIPRDVRCMEGVHDLPVKPVELSNDAYVPGAIIKLPIVHLAN